MSWFKGNLHCHSNCSDGQMPPSTVAQYYKSIEHDFLGIADHNQYTPVESWADAGKILGIPCCEYSGEGCCHVVAVGVETAVAPNVNEKDMRKRRAADAELIAKAGNDPREKNILILQDGIDKTLAAGGIPIIAHPFWHWTYDYQEVLELTNCTHFEVCNAGPDCNSIPLPGKSYPDEMWDNLLSRGYRIFGVANDDAHIYMDKFKPRAPLGGRAWNVVKASSLTKDNILEGLRKGHFYATTGMEIDKYKVSAEGIYISIDPQQDERIIIDFIGQNGKILSSTHAPYSEYKFSGDEIYVRCRIASTAGLWAWTQPVFLDDLQTSIDWTGIE